MKTLKEIKEEFKKFNKEIQDFVESKNLTHKDFEYLMTAVILQNVINMIEHDNKLKELLLGYLQIEFEK